MNEVDELFRQSSLDCGDQVDWIVRTMIFDSFVVGAGLALNFGVVYECDRESISYGLLGFPEKLLCLQRVVLRLEILPLNEHGRIRVDFSEPGFLDRVQGF